MMFMLMLEPFLFRVLAIFAVRGDQHVLERGPLSYATQAAVAVCIDIACSSYNR